MSTPQQQAGSVIEVKTSFFFLAFLLALFKPQASIDGGQPFPVGWGTAPIPVPPGRHQVEVWLPYLFFSQMGKNGAIVDVPAGGSVQVWWKSPWLAFLKGTIVVSGPTPIGIGAGQAAAAPWAGGAASPSTPPAPAPGAGWGSQPETAAAAPGGWHPDPSGRHEQRYYDGTAWTDHVVDQGAQSTDPIGG